LDLGNPKPREKACDCCWLWVFQGLDEKAYGDGRDRCQRRIEALVCELYGLTEKEIALVEEPP
jgi:hypothetical protein